MTSSKSPTQLPPASDEEVGHSHAEFGSTGRSRTWLWPAAAFVAILLAVVVVGRLGQTPGESIPPDPTPLHPVAVVPERSLSTVTSPGRSTAAGLPAYRIGIRSDGERYDDGIPARLNGNQVVRVRDAATLPTGSTVLVGGWSQTGGCMNLGLQSKCPVVLSDAPFLSDASVSLQLTGQAAFGDEQGAQIYQATVQAGDCSTGTSGGCLPELNVGEAIWSGDAATNTGPIKPGTLLAELSTDNLNLDFKPFEESGYCPLDWPYQSYAVSSPTLPRAEWASLPIRLVVLYSTPQALDSDGTTNRNRAASMTAFDASNRCVSIPGGVNDAAWVVLDNAMVLTGFDDPGIRTQIRDVLDKVASAN